MIAVLVCSIVNSGLIVGLLAGIVTGFVRSRVAIAEALRGDPLESGFKASATTLRAVAA
nr:hypothetical protein [Polymorphobacter sp.]